MCPPCERGAHHFPPFRSGGSSTSLVRRRTTPPGSFMNGWRICLEGNVEIVALPAGSRAESARAGNRSGRKPAAEPEDRPNRRSVQRLEKAQHASFATLG